jgi:hypothetical protein
MDIGFVHNTSVDHTSNYTDYQNADNYFAVYQDTYYSDNYRMQLWLNAAVDSPPYPGATLAFDQAAEVGTVSGKWGVLGSANQDSFIEIMAGSTRVGYAYPASYNINFNSDAYVSNLSDVDGDKLDGGGGGNGKTDYYIAYNQPQETRLSWTVNPDGTGGKMSMEVDYYRLSDGTTRTYSLLDQNFLGVGVPDGIRIRTGWTSYVNRALIMESLAIETIPEPITIALLAIGGLFIRRK